MKIVKTVEFNFDKNDVSQIPTEVLLNELVKRKDTSHDLFIYHTGIDDTYRLETKYGVEVEGQGRVSIYIHQDKYTPQEINVNYKSK